MASIEVGEHEERVASYTFRTQELSRRVDLALNLLAYLTVAVSAAMSLTTGQTLHPLPVVLFLAVNLAWVALFRLLWQPPNTWDKRAIIGGLLAIAIGSQAFSLVGIGLDWLLPVLTVSILAFYLRARTAAIVAGGTMLVVAAYMLAITGDMPLAARFQDIISIVPAYLFSFIFSVFLCQQIEQRAQAEDLVTQLEEAQEQLRAHAESVEELAVARERNRMAREIHDTLGHYLTILAVQLETAIKLKERDDPRLREELVEARRVASECLVEVRRSVRALRPVDPTEASFAGALERLREEFEATAPETELTLDIEGPAQALEPELRLALYRCAQEAMTNVRKHAKATKVLVRVRVDSCRAELTVLDNGRAAQEAPAHEPGFGLLGMRERMALLGGTVRASAEQGRGWRVEVVVPISATLVEGAAGATEHASSAERVREAGRRPERSEYPETAAVATRDALDGRAARAVRAESQDKSQ